jgi:hypothetical protein
METLIDVLLNAEQWCSVCDDGFGEQVIHCRHCDYHAMAGFFTLNDRCKSCYKGLRGSKRSDKNRHTREEIETIVRRREFWKRAWSLNG